MGYFNKRRGTVVLQHIGLNTGLIGLCMICPPLWGPYVIGTGFQLFNALGGDHTPESWAKRQAAIARYQSK